MNLFFNWAKARHVALIKPPALLKARRSVSLTALSIAAALSILPIQLPIGLNLIAGTSAALAQTTDPRTLKKMERTVKRAERKLNSVDRDIDRMETDTSKIRSSQLDRTQEKLTDLQTDLLEVDEGFEGLSEINERLSVLSNRIDALKAAHAAGSSPDNATAKSDNSGTLSPADEKRLKGQISRVESNIANAEKALGRFLSEPALTAERLQGVARDRIASAKEKLSDLTELSPETASKFEADLSAIVSRFEARTIENAAVSGNRDAAAKKLERMTASGSYEAQSKVVKILQEQSTQFENLTWDSHIFLDNGNTASIVEAATSWPDVTTSFDEYMLENADIMELGGALPTLSLILQKNLPNASANLANLADMLPALYNAKAQAIIELGNEIVADQNFNLFDSQLAGRQTVAKEMFWLRNWLAFYKAMPAVSSASEIALQSKLDETIAKIDELKEVGRDKIIAQNSLDPDFYEGSDREEILKLVEAGWRSVHGDDVAIKEIRIPTGQWSRTLGERWDKVDRMFVLVDFSTIDAFVVEEPENGIVTFWRVEVQKRHLEQDAMISNPASRNRHAPKPNQQMLADNL